MPLQEPRRSGLPGTSNDVAIFTHRDEARARVARFLAASAPAHAQPPAAGERSTTP